METRNHSTGETLGRALFSIIVLALTVIVLSNDGWWCRALVVISTGISLEAVVMLFRIDFDAEMYSLQRLVRLFPATFLVTVVGAVCGITLYETSPGVTEAAVYSTYVNDVFAYVYGKLLGRTLIHRRFWRYSPNKTWEGTLGGLLATCHGGLIYGVWRAVHMDEGWWRWPLLSLAAAIGAILGDMLGSAVKRSAGVKDSAPGFTAKLWLGHGGWFDRFLSVLMALITVALTWELTAPYV